MLRDTAISSTVAIVADKCLVLRVGTPRTTSLPSHNATDFEQCETSQSTYLETALVINEEAVFPNGLVKRPITREGLQLRWSVSAVAAGQSLSLGDSGYVITIRRLGRGQLLVKWGITNEIHNFIQRLARRGEMYHWEYIDSLNWPVKPIPIHVVSENFNRN
jgi:hypothetical protein